MNKSMQIYLGGGNTSNVGNDAHVKVKLEQDIDTIEFLSMSITTEDAYQNFNSDYGVLVGRVVANGGIGIPNAKISIFIPLTDEDSIDGDIVSIYPYSTPRDKNSDGKRYNLLPRVSTFDQELGQWTPKQAFGSFPIKEEVVTNSNILNVYKKYYKYTALTNNAGDYMIFGVPVGTQTVHMSVDITDIGKYSMNPASMVTNLGYSPNLFTSNNTRIKPSNDLNDLPNIETQEISVDIIPFWGDTENFEIGVTRQDFRIRSVLKNTFIIFGSVFTDGDNAMWGDDGDSGTRRISELYRAMEDEDTTVGMYSKRIGKVTEKIYYYPPEITDEMIDTGNVDPEGNDMLLLDRSEYSLYRRDGDFVVIINCNRNKVITNEVGVEVPIGDDSPNGVFTKFRGFLTLEITPDDVPMNFKSAFGSNTEIVPFRFILKFPQFADRNKTFKQPENGVEDDNTKLWRRQNYTFGAGKFYTLSKFHGTIFNDSTDDDNQSQNNGFFNHDTINTPYRKDPFWNTGIIITSDVYEVGDPNNLLYPNASADFPSNTITSDRDKLAFGANWMNMSIYLPQFGYANKGYAYIRYVRCSDHFTYQFRSGAGGSDNHGNSYYLEDNAQPIAAGQFNTKWFARSDINWTDIVEVPLADITQLRNQPKGFAYNPESSNILTGNYRNGKYVPTNWGSACPLNGGKLNGNPTAIEDPNMYFYKGFDTADCIQYLYELGLVN